MDTSQYYFNCLYCHKKKKQKKIAQLLQHPNISNKEYLDENTQYFIQTPLSLIHSQYIPILGDENLAYKVSFNNFFQKWITLLEIFPMFSLELKSKKHLINVKRVHPLSLRYQYHIYLDGRYIGKLEQHKLFTKKLIKNLISYKFTSERETYLIENKKFTTQTLIKNKKDNNILIAKRSFFDLFKKKQTNMRGEQHKIEVRENNSFINEIWLAVYTQCILDKQQKR
ncbi:hypothetical protein ACYCKH_03325 [Staphylococcus capitis]